MATITIKHLITKAVAEIDDSSFPVHERRGWRRLDDPAFQEQAPPADPDEGEAADEPAPETKGRKPRT